jgi:hypothetical protein
MRCTVGSQRARVRLNFYIIGNLLALPGTAKEINRGLILCSIVTH